MRQFTTFCVLTNECVRPAQGPVHMTLPLSPTSHGCERLVARMSSARPVVHRRTAYGVRAFGQPGVVPLEVQALQDFHIGNAGRLCDMSALVGGWRCRSRRHVKCALRAGEELSIAPIEMPYQSYHWLAHRTSPAMGWQSGTF